MGQKRSYLVRNPGLRFIHMFGVPKKDTKNKKQNGLVHQQIKKRVPKFEIEKCTRYKKAFLRNGTKNKKINLVQIAADGFPPTGSCRQMAQILLLVFCDFFTTENTKESRRARREFFFATDFTDRY